MSALGLLFLVGVAAVAGGAGASQQQFDRLSQDLTAAQFRLVALEQEQAVVAQQRTESQKQLGIRQGLLEFYQKRAEASLGDRVLLTEGLHTSLPMTLAEAEAQGYVLLDSSSDAPCLADEEVLHYGQAAPRVTAGVPWHGALFLPIYGKGSGRLKGMVLESTTPQPAPWKHHPLGHGDMLFEHWSMYIWFTDPPPSLGAGGHQ